MKRTNSFCRFFVHNRRLLLFLLLPLLGWFCGMLLCKNGVLSDQWIALVKLQPVTGGVPGVFSAWYSSCFQATCLLLLLFFCGVSAFGVPLVLLVPLVWGIGFGVAETYYAENGGLLVLAAVLLPPTIMELVALLMACSEALRMSLLTTVQLLPRSARCGGLWQDFRLYSVRFLVLWVLVLGAGALDVGLRLLFKGLL